MEYKIHLIYGTIISLVIYFFSNTSIYFVLFFWIGSWLIPDLDHLFHFVLKNKSINIKNFLDYSHKNRSKWKKLPNDEKKKYKYSLLFFHSIEFVIILLLLSMIKKEFLYIGLGLIFHDILDVIDYYKRKENIFIKLSFIYTLVYNKKREIFL